MSPVPVWRRPTVELHGDLATLLVVHDGVGAVVSLPDHDVGVQLRPGPCSARQRREAAPNCVDHRGRGMGEGVYLLASASPELMRDGRAAVSPSTGDYCRRREKKTLVNDSKVRRQVVLSFILQSRD